jgi:hypothetical protein
MHVCINFTVVKGSQKIWATSEFFGKLPTYIKFKIVHRAKKGPIWSPAGNEERHLKLALKIDAFMLVLKIFFLK